MLNWAKQQLANVAGTQEPEYGPDAIQTVSQQAETTPYTELTRDDLKWTALQSTCVETQTFYAFAEDGTVGMAQLIYNNLAGLRTTTQFTTKIFYPDGRAPLWTSEQVDDHQFANDKTCFHSDKASIDLLSDGETYHIKSQASPKTKVDIKVKRAAPSFKVGQDGTSYYGTDPQKPWGSMRHVFWPRCDVEGDFVTKDGTLKMTGRGVFIHALQGMKPHHLAARWNFVSFHSSKYSAVMMEYTTPPSYGTTTVNMGGIVSGDKLIYAGARNSATHTASKHDAEVDWPEPTALAFKWNEGGEGAHAELAISMSSRADRIDVMAEVPGFVKQLVGAAAGTRPYIYQVS
ncbi:MAG: hypothetical protein Q9162_001431 [Coniocarpon cinnabarinum]